MSNRQNYSERIEINKKGKFSIGLLYRCFPEVSTIRFIVWLNNNKYF